MNASVSLISVLVIVSVSMMMIMHVESAPSYEKSVPHVVRIKEFRHFETLASASRNKPLLVLLYTEDPMLAVFSQACTDLAGKSTCVALDLRTLQELAAQIMKQTLPEDQKVKALYPVVLMWHRDAFQPSFQPEISFESITYYFDRLTGPPLTKILSAGHLQGLLSTDKPLALAYFPESAHFFENEHYKLWQWYQSVTRLAFHKILFVEVNNPDHLPRAHHHPDKPFFSLHTDFWPERQLPSRFWEQSPDQAAQWLIERSFGSASKVTKDNFDEFVQRGRGKPIFLIWVLDFVAKNEKYTEMAHILSFYF